jgi:hypothetical protein
MAKVTACRFLKIWETCYNGSQKEVHSDEPKENGISNACVLAITVEKPMRTKGWCDRLAETSLNWQPPFASISATRP